MNWKFTDFRGVEIKVGSKIVYASGGGSSVYVYEAEVLELIPNKSSYAYKQAEYYDLEMQTNGYDPEKQESMMKCRANAYKVKAKRKGQCYDSSDGNFYEKDIIVHLQTPSNITVLPDGY